MAAPKGNRFWEARSSHGRKPIFATPEALEAACLEYFEWVENNPLQESKAFSVAGDIKVVSLNKMRAMTLEGLCLFLDIDTNTWRLYAGRKDYVQVTTRVEAAIRSQKFAGAAADLLNANIIARDLGLADKSDTTVKGDPDAPLRVESHSERELAKAMLAIMTKAALDPAG